MKVKDGFGREHTWNLANLKPAHNDLVPRSSLHLLAREILKETFPTYPVLEEVPMKQLMIQNSDQVIIVADSSKFGINAPYKVCSWADIDHVITDDRIEKSYSEFLYNKGISPIVVNSSAASGDE